MNDPPESNQIAGEALLSPTRTYAPVIKTMLSECRKGIIGMVHCSGGTNKVPKIWRKSRLY